jgi:tetratricopeptide (TPR) repeat protein
MGNRIAILATCALVLMPWGYFRGRQEIALWHAAAAQRATWKGEHETARKHLDRALLWAPTNADLRLQRAATDAELGSIDAALADAEEAYRLAPGDDLVLDGYCIALARAGRSAEAAKLVDERLKALNSDETDELTQYRKETAFYLAHASQELDRALELINLALVRFPNRADLIDTRGFVYLKRGELELALKDADLAVNFARQGLFQQQAYDRAQAIDARDLARLNQAGKKELAVALHHRSLIYAAQSRKAVDAEQRINLEASAALERNEIRTLGFAPDRLL